MFFQRFPSYSRSTSTNLNDEALVRMETVDASISQLADAADTQSPREASTTLSTSSTMESIPREGKSVEEPDDSLEDPRDTTSRTSTRLVKFQLFETKSVVSCFYVNANMVEILYPGV